MKSGPGGQLNLNGNNVSSQTLCPSEDLILSITGIADAANKSFEYRRGSVVIHTSSSTSFVVPNPSGTASYSAYVYDMPLLAGNINPDACRSLTNSIVITIAHQFSSIFSDGHRFFINFMDFLRWSSIFHKFSSIFIDFHRFLAEILACSFISS